MALHIGRAGSTANQVRDRNISRAGTAEFIPQARGRVNIASEHSRVLKSLSPLLDMPGWILADLIHSASGSLTAAIAEECVHPNGTKGSMKKILLGVLALCTVGALCLV